MPMHIAGLGSGRGHGCPDSSKTGALGQAWALGWPGLTIPMSRSGIRPSEFRGGGPLLLQPRLCPTLRCPAHNALLQCLELIGTCISPSTWSRRLASAALTRTGVPVLAVPRQVAASTRPHARQPSGVAFILRHHRHLDFLAGPGIPNGAAGTPWRPLRWRCCGSWSWKATRRSCGPFTPAPTTGCVGCGRRDVRGGLFRWNGRCPCPDCRVLLTLLGRAGFPLRRRRRRRRS